jgi:AcrR family transcriptional regulator
LSEEQFIDAALALADSDGLMTMNVRSLAACLKMSPNSLYTYFESKQALLDRMFGKAMSELPLEDIAGGDPRAEFEAAFLALFDAMSTHPAAVELLMAGVGSPQVDLMRERLHGLLEQAGLDTRDRVRAINLATSLVMGSVIVGTFRSGETRTRELTRRRRLSARRFPLLRKASTAAAQVPSPGMFAYELSGLLKHVFDDA